MRPPSGIRIRTPSVDMDFRSLSTKLKAIPWRIVLSFFLLGVINNVLYVIILSAALDLVGVDSPKALVLLANILPSVLVKMGAPYVFEYIPYKVRVLGVVLVNFFGMLLVSSSTTIMGKLSGVAMASAASGAGEITFLQISYFYSSVSLAAWSSGTGGAGIVGGVLYVASTTWLRISPERTLLASSLLPLVMLFTYFIFLPPMNRNVKHTIMASGHSISHSEYSAINDHATEEDRLEAAEEDLSSTRADTKTLQQKLKIARPLIVPFMVPLFLVYFAEYTINQGLSPTLLFEISETPFKHYRDIYPTYATLYQIGVFVSRSSSPFVRIKRLYLPALGQCGLLAFMLLQSLFVLLPSIYPLFLLILLEGIFGGLVYVNAFHNVSESTTIEEADKEFSIGAIGVADSLGILAAALVSLWLEPAVCRHQVSTGRPWCRME